MIKVFKEMHNSVHDYGEFEDSITRSFWTRLDEIQEDFEDLGAEVYEINEEYISFRFDNIEYIAYFGHANSTIWIERIKEF